MCCLDTGCVHQTSHALHGQKRDKRERMKKMEKKEKPVSVQEVSKKKWQLNLQIHHSLFIKSPQI
jgi:hypothetical protein